MINLTFSGSDASALFVEMQNFLLSIQGMGIPPLPTEAPVEKPEPVKEVKKVVKTKAVEEKKTAPKEDLFEMEAPKNIPAPIHPPHNKKKITKAEVQAALQTVMKTDGILKVKEILGKFNADSISKLDEKRYPELMAVIGSEQQPAELS